MSRYQLRYRIAALIATFDATAGAALETEGLILAVADQ